MKKLNLNADDLRVESFATDENDAPRRGTVRARNASDGFCLPCSQGYSASEGYPVCNCDTTYTQRPPYCDPSENTYCISEETVHPCNCF